MTLCPCQSGQEYDLCCGPIIRGAHPAPTAEALMRSRFSAYAKHEIPYLENSLHPDHRKDYDPIAAKEWAEKSDWVKLDIVNKQGGGEQDQQGVVEFIASYRHKGNTLTHHEIGEFTRHNGKWYYVDGKIVTPGTVRNTGPKIGRNDPCPCGSGKKYKKCCG